MKISAQGQRIIWKICIACISLFAYATNTPAQNADTWQHEATIYGWYSGIDGTIQYPGGSGSDISVDVSDIIENLEMIFMAGTESRYNRWSIIADVVYMDVQDDAGRTVNIGPGTGVPVSAEIDVEISSWVVQGGVGYDLVQTEQGSLAAFGGLRYLSVDADVDMAIDGPMNRPPAQASDSESVADGIIGVRGAYRLNDNWYFPYHADIGTGDSDFTWQLFGGIGYRFSWGDIKFGYRFLSWEFDDGQFMEDLELSGPIMGVGIRF